MVKDGDWAGDRLLIESLSLTQKYIYIYIISLCYCYCCIKTVVAFNYICTCALVKITHAFFSNIYKLSPAHLLFNAVAFWILKLLKIAWFVNFIVNVLSNIIFQMELL